MRKLFTVLTLVLFQFIFSQENTSTSQLSKISLSENGNFFIYDNQAYGLKHYNIIFKNEEAKSILANARANKSIGNVLGFTGGFLMGCQVLKKVYTFYINTKIRLQFKYNSKIYLQPPFFCNNFSIYNLPF